MTVGLTKQAQGSAPGLPCTVERDFDDHVGLPSSAQPTREIAEPSTYVHLKAFLADAPPRHLHARWAGVASKALEQLTRVPLWISMAGLKRRAQISISGHALGRKLGYFRRLG